MILDFLKKTKNKKNDTINFSKQKYMYDEWATTKTVEGFFSVVDKLPNPDIVLKKAGKNISVLRNLENHYQVGSGIEQRKAGTLSSEWMLKENNSDKKHFELYDYIFKNIDIYSLINNILDTPLYGYVPIEIVWQKTGEYIIPEKITAKPQEWFYFNTEGEFFFKDKNEGGKKLIDFNSYKFLLPRNNPSYTNPYGKAILSRCFWNVVFINGGMEFWVKFTEKYGMPFTYGKYDRSMTDKEKEEFLNALVNMVQAAAAVIPNDGSVETVNTGSSTNTDIYERLVNKCENNISKALLGQTLTTDVGSNGSYAASQTHMGVRADIINSDKLLVENTINQLIKYINIINFNDEVIPEFAFVKPENLSIEKADRDLKVASLGVEFSEDYLLRTYGYKKGDIKLVDKEKNTFNFSDSESEEIKGLASNMPDNDTFLSDKELQSQIEPELEKIIEFFNKTKDADEALEKLEDLYPELSFKELEDKLAKVIFISDLMGRLDVHKEVKNAEN